MAKKTDELAPVTADDVAQAWRDAAAAKEAVADLKNKFLTGDDSVTQSAIASQQGVAEWLELVAQRVEHQRTRYETAFAKAARQDLKAEILAGTTTSADELSALIDSVYEAACKFVDIANAHDAAVQQWGERAKALGAPTRGVVSAEHEGLGLDAAGTILVDEARVPSINAKHVLGLLFTDAFQGGILPVRNERNLATAHQILARLGREAV